MVATLGQPNIWTLVLLEFSVRLLQTAL